MAQVYRDAQGVPHVRADSVADLARGQGRVTAHDRSWQLEWLRRRATGTTAEVVGATGLPWDRFARRARLAEVGRRAHAALSPPTRDLVAAYVEGVGEGLRAAPELDVLGISAQPWEPWLPLAVFHAQHVLFASLGGELWSRRLHAVLGDDAPLLSYEGPVPSGSNAWAVGGGRTASGRPLVGGDPHRAIESPGVYAQVRLVCEDPDDAFDVAGFAFPGVPGVQHFAHAGDVAWAITNAVATTQRVHEEADPPRDVVEQHTETIAVRDAEPVDVEVVRTARGLLIEPGLSLQDAPTDLAGTVPLGFEALLPLLRARTVDDVDRALDHWVEPVNNVVVADVHGTVRYRIAGRVPVRGDDGTWTGWLDPVPRTEVPADGEVVTANERRGPESASIGTSFAPPYRADRLRALLGGRSGLDADDCARMHDDALLQTVPVLLPLLDGAADVPEVLTGFDGVMDAGSTAAGAFAAWRHALVLRVAAHPVLDGLRDAPDHHDPLFAPWLGLTSHVALALPTLVARGAELGLDLPALAAAALDDVRDVLAAPPPWGETHVFTPLHVLDVLDGPEGLAGEGPAPWAVPAVGLSGDTDCVRCTGSYPGLTDDCFRGSVARYVWDLADREAGGWVVPTGAAGDPRDPHHHDQLPLWTAGTLAPIVSDWARLTRDDLLS